MQVDCNHTETGFLATLSANLAAVIIVGIPLGSLSVVSIHCSTCGIIYNIISELNVKWVFPRELPTIQFLDLVPVVTLSAAAADYNIVK